MTDAGSTPEQSLEDLLNDCRSPCPSVTESLIQFEALEKEIDDVDDVFHFRTSATRRPFVDVTFIHLLPPPLPFYFVGSVSHFISIDDELIQGHHLESIN